MIKSLFLVTVLSSLSLEFRFKLFGQAIVGPERCIDCLFLEAWHPVINLVEAVTEADALFEVKIAKVVSIGTLNIALLVKSL